MTITPTALAIFMLVAVLMTFVVAPLLGTTLLWLTSKLWRFENRTFKNSFKVTLIILGVMLATVLIFQTLFIKDSFGQFAQSSPQSFLWFMFGSFLIGIIVGIIAIKKFFQESLARSIGASITFFVFIGILFAITIVAVVVISGQSSSTQTSVQNNNVVTTQGITSGSSPEQAITAKATTLTSREKGVFVVSKYPSNAVSWTLRLDCPTGIVGGMQSVDGSSASLVGGVVNCNQDIALDKDPYAKYPTQIIFVMQFINQGKIDQVVNIVSKTFDSTGTLLNQSTLPITVQINTDAVIQNTVVNSATSAEIYYGNNGSSYAGVCTKSSGMLDAKNELTTLSTSVVCKDSQAAWAMSAQLKTDATHYWCADSTGSAVARNSAITTTSCK